MTILFPINGKGERFKKAGVIVNKPFIQFNGKTFLEHALSSYSQKDTFIFFVRWEFRDAIRSIVESLHLKYSLYPLEFDTKGPLETVMAVTTKPGLYCLELLVKGEILIADCDSMLNPSELSEAISLFRECGASGGVTYRITSDEECSFCVLDYDNWVMQAKERDRYFLLDDRDIFSNKSTTGPYWFKHYDEFLKAGYKALNDGIVTISPVYNYLIRDGGRVKAFPVSTFKHFGTPDELKRYSC